MAFNTLGIIAPTLERGAPASSVSGTTFALNTAFVPSGSGNAIGYRFTAPLSQTSASFTLYMYMTAISGSPTAVRMDLYNGPSSSQNVNRPDPSAALSSTGNVDVSAQPTASWTTFTIASASLVQGATYWAIIYNATATPASNFPTYMVRGFQTAFTSRYIIASTTAGFSTDSPTVYGSDAPVVTKFSDGTIVGMPGVRSVSHASNTNDRGMRFNYPYSVRVNGVYCGAANTSVSNIKVFQGVTEVASTPTMDFTQRSQGSTNYFTSPIVFSANTNYDVVMRVSASATAGPRIDAGDGIPADISSSFPSFVKYIDGTPGSFTTSYGWTGMWLLYDEILVTGTGDTEFSSATVN